MQRSEIETLFQALGATAEIMGTEIKPAALTLMVDDLSEYPLESVLSALKRCRREMSGRLTLDKIIDRINAADGFPGADEAWALMSRPEDDTVVIIQEMAEAMQVARPLLVDGDNTAARMAFRETYTRIVNEARERRIKPQWFASLGHDPLGRAQPIADAVRAGKLQLEHSLGLLGPDSKAELLKLTGNTNHPFLIEYKQAQIEAQKPLDRDSGLKHIAALKGMFRQPEEEES